MPTLVIFAFSLPGVKGERRSPRLKTKREAYGKSYTLRRNGLLKIKYEEHGNIPTRLRDRESFSYGVGWDGLSLYNTRMELLGVGLMYLFIAFVFPSLLSVSFLFFLQFFIIIFCSFIR